MTTRACKPQCAAFYQLAPLGKFPVLADDANGRVVPESTIIIEYLAARYPGRTTLIPRDLDLALEARAMDRFFDQQIPNGYQLISPDNRLISADIHFE